MTHPANRTGGFQGTQHQGSMTHPANRTGGLQGTQHQIHPIERKSSDLRHQVNKHPVNPVHPGPLSGNQPINPIHPRPGGGGGALPPKVSGNHPINPVHPGPLSGKHRSNLGLGVTNPLAGKHPVRPVNNQNININKQTEIINNNVTNVTNVNNNTSVTNITNPYPVYHQGWLKGAWTLNQFPGWVAGGSSTVIWAAGPPPSEFVNPFFSSTVVVQPVVVPGEKVVVVQQPAVAPLPSVYNYSQPLDLTLEPPAPEIVDQAVASFDAARAAFRARDYDQAIKLADDGLGKTPNDPALHEFRAVCLFAMGRYDEAAIPMYTVLTAGPGWDWTTLCRLYADINVYTDQLRALEAYCAATPKAASARFLVASLYMTQGSNEAAANMLRQVVELQPDNRLSTQLLDLLTPKQDSQDDAAQQSQSQGGDAAGDQAPPAAEPGSEAQGGGD
jgi:hypothetical protein